MTKRALIVDDHPVIRDALTTSLVSLNVFDEMETAKSLRELLDKLECGENYQLLILDLSLTDVTGSDAMIYIREHYTDIPILVFSGHDSTDIIAECFEKGVHGFVPKSSSMQVFVNAIRMVMAGSIYIPPCAARLMGIESGDGNADQPAHPVEVERLCFTPRQQQVYDQLVLGIPNKVIAKRLNIAEGTVKTHLNGIYRTLRVANRTQAILKSKRLQMIN